MDILQIAITLLLFILLVIPVGKYLYKVMNFEKPFGDSFFDKIDNLIFKIAGIKKDNMHWKKYVGSLIITNMVMALLVYIMFRVQSLLGLNPNGIKALEPSLAFNTAVSFITNTNLQHYSGEWGLSYLSQMAAITFLMFTAAATGLAAAMAFIRGISGRWDSLGNFFVDLVRIITRVLLPFSIVVTLLLVWQGVPQTLSPNQTVTTIQGTLQDVPLGPVASFEAIKQLGTNGGGFFGANSAHPFENPTPLSNLIEMLSMMIIPGALVYAFGLTLKNKKQGWAIFAAMSILFIISLSACYYAEKSGNPLLARTGLSQSMGNMEGKEVRFGIAGSALFTSITTAFTTGAVNNMHDSLTPLGGLVPLWQMMLNVIFGGEGVGFINMLMYAILAVFLCGLMVGRTPEFLGKKIEGREIKLIALAILVHPFITLIPTAIALVTSQGVAAITNPGFHGLSQVLYEFTSAAANNGSGFEGLSDNTLFWNVSTGVVIFLGRYISIIALLAVAASMASKKTVPIGVSTFRTDNALFTIILVAVVLIVGALTFLPAIALGPVAEHLTLVR
ncbi:potassium-transporting ATPase potassium-binding subunit [Clostridium polyendosporum]|uniref:Potassium-transporting ATPase potassium-binding subunit n=1 Tax=Clostridium polyendosporum TaxID=69208 RepID=A0A919S291_9CLOT|nr:potassium-transporting ATPase subunit KdpA [Clostridium polyendosporum]GIM30591.1 potassium-transporting ATPase potassium-binding subunit [Clostridium polyendosporum]